MGKSLGKDLTLFSIASYRGRNLLRIPLSTRLQLGARSSKENWFHSSCIQGVKTQKKQKKCNEERKAAGAREVSPEPNTATKVLNQIIKGLGPDGKPLAGVKKMGVSEAAALVQASGGTLKRSTLGAKLN